MIKRKSMEEVIALRVQNNPETTKKRTLTDDSPKLDDLIRHSHSLEDSDLLTLRDAISALVDAKSIRVQNNPETTKTRTLTDKKTSQRGSFEEKMIRGHGPYIYLRYWSGGKHRSTYLGKPTRL